MASSGELAGDDMPADKWVTWPERGQLATPELRAEVARTSAIQKLRGRRPATDSFGYPQQTPFDRDANEARNRARASIIERLRTGDMIASGRVMGVRRSERVDMEPYEFKFPALWDFRNGTLAVAGVTFYDVQVRVRAKVEVAAPVETSAGERQRKPVSSASAHWTDRYYWGAKASKLEAWLAARLSDELSGAEDRFQHKEKPQGSDMNDALAHLSRALTALAQGLVVNKTPLRPKLIKAVATLRWPWLTQHHWDQHLDVSGSPLRTALNEGRATGLYNDHEKSRIVQVLSLTESGE